LSYGPARRPAGPARSSRLRRSMGGSWAGRSCSRTWPA